MDYAYVLPFSSIKGPNTFTLGVCSRRPKQPLRTFEEYATSSGRESNYMGIVKVESLKVVVAL